MIPTLIFEVYRAATVNMVHASMRTRPSEVIKRSLTQSACSPARSAI